MSTTLLKISGLKVSYGGIKAVKGIAARPFVVKTATRTDVYKKALDTYWATIDKYFTDKVFKDRITKFRKTR